MNILCYLYVEQDREKLLDKAQIWRQVGVSHKIMWCPLTIYTYNYLYKISRFNCWLFTNMDKPYRFAYKKN